MPRPPLRSVRTVAMPSPSAGPPASARSSAGPARATVVAGLLLVLAMLVASPAGATARDVEIRPVPDAAAGLAVSPAVSLTRDVAAEVVWPLAITNGGPVRTEVELSVHLAVADEGGAPTAGPVADWAILPRTRIGLDAGEGAEFSVLLQPPADLLPIAMLLQATTVGDDARSVRAVRVLWPAGHEPRVELTIQDAVDDDGRQTVTVADRAGPSVVDLRVETSAWPRRTRAIENGPLVVLPGNARLLEVEPVSGLLGARTEAVVAVDGVEAARAHLDLAADPLRLAAAAALAAVAVLAAVLGTRRLRQGR